MSEPRLNHCYLCIGRKGTGKTTIARYIAKESGFKKIIIIDTDDHPSYKDVPILNLDQVKKLKSGNCRLIESDMNKVFAVLNAHQANAFIICEDAAKYINSNISVPAKSFIIDHRKRNFDLLLMFHFLADIPPYVAKQYDTMFLFKTGDSLQANMAGKFANWHTIKEKLERILKHKSFNYCEAIAVDE